MICFLLVCLLLVIVIFIFNGVYFVIGILWFKVVVIVIFCVFFNFNIDCIFFLKKGVLIVNLLGK